MIALVLDIIGWSLIAVGAFLIITAGIGLIRFPDFYTRLHAAGVTDTFGSELILIGMATQADDPLVVIKLALVAVFLFFTSPAATHAVAHAAHIAGLRPLTGDLSYLRRNDDDDEEGRT